MKKNWFITLALFSAVLLSATVQSCYYDNEEYLYGKPNTTCDTAAVKFSTVVLPLMTAQCATAGCHNAASASAGANLSTYAATKSYITNSKEFFLGSINYTAGFSKMPKGGNKMAACDISKIEAWIKAGMPNN
jgi:hypothetical protein